ncbi:hypothetical protein L1787_15620 [Acuticoccus sp. M5D2P5]|uniref:hypothetical protein n=1 Tax=Acuticoccus kalidii TaxID=2910977 RepID=UPI001F1FCA77|nr:hypothetical protein [Acuticoccus kalidii]MCF3934832.1 hypothetical protein [Acuticoccus kalidii]
MTASRNGSHSAWSARRRWLGAQRADAVAQSVHRLHLADVLRRRHPVGSLASHRTLYAYVWRTTSRQQIHILAFTCVIAPLTMAPLELQRRIVDDAISGGSLSLIGLYGAVYLAISLIQGGLKYALNMQKALVLETVARSLRLQILSVSRPHIAGGEAEPPPNVGTMVSMLLSEAEDVGGFASDSIAVPALQISTMFWVLAYMLWIEPLIAVLAVAIYLPQAVLVPLVQHKINRLIKRKTERMRRLGATEVQITGGYGSTRLAHILTNHIFTLRMIIYRLKYFLTFLGNFLDALGPIMVLCVGGYLVIAEQTSVATLVVFISGLQRISDPWDVLINFFRTTQIARVSYGMIDEALTVAGRPRA